MSVSTTVVLVGFATSLHSAYLVVFLEIVKTPRLFSSMENTFSNLKSKLSYASSFSSNVSFYPMKSSIEDFYTKGLFCKKSPTMLKCSQNARKQATNF